MLPTATAQNEYNERIRSTEDRLGLVLAAARKHAIVQLDRERRIAGWNSGAQQLFGWAPEEITGRSGDILFTQEDLDAGIPGEEAAEAMNSGSAEDDRWMVRKDGSRFWVTACLVPLRDKTGRHVGFVKIMRDFTDRKLREEERERRVLRERRQLESRVAATESELRRLAGALMNAQERERRLIARELHDDLVQRLALLEMRLSALPADPELEHIRAELAGISEHIRNLSRKFHSSVLDRLGLEVALRGLCTQLARTRSAPVRFISRRVPRGLAPELAVNLYRIAQEASSNAIRHSPDCAVTVFLYTTDSDLRLSVRDNGKGFDPRAATGHGGLGLITMDQRSRAIHGRLRIFSSPGRGTTIRVAVPLDEL